MKRIPLLALQLVLPLAATVSAVPQDHWWGERVEASLARSAENRSELEDALVRVTENQRTGLAFLIEHMVPTDLRSLKADFLLENVALAYQVRDEVPWGSRTPEDVFLNDVLPYANVSESRDSWRREFHERFLPVVRECKTAAEAAQRLNEHVFGELGVRYSTERKRADQSPKECIESGLASCTGLSIVLADACRSVGVPARLAGIPRWANKPGNHTWVEIWDGDWHFTGAAEPDARGLDHAWFQGDAALAVADSKWNAIYAVSYRKTELEFPMVWSRDHPPVHAVNVTARYTGQSTEERDPDVCRLMVQVSRNDVRVAVKVRVVDREDPARTFEGTSKDESFDTNDLLTFEVPRQRSYTIEATSEEGWSVGSNVDVGDATQRIVRLDSINEEDGLEQALESYMRAGPEERARWEFPAELDRRLLEDEVGVRRAAWRAYKSHVDHAPLRADFDARRVRWREHESPYTLKQVGERPAAGWPLFIAMHGGGGVPKQVNDSQWQHMQVYYHDHPEVGGYLYLALRAPNDNWNGFYDDTISALVEELVRQQLLFADVDPDRVFLMGYSHGGYGAFVIGTKVPHRFAAVHASAAAPTGGETAGENLRTTVFTYMVGERDSAHGRIDRCRQFEAELNGLRGDREDIYPVTFEYQAGRGHGGLPDRDKTASMYSNVREPAPRELTWKLTDDVLRDFFWLTTEEPRDGAQVQASCRDNRIELELTGLEHLSLCLDSRLVDVRRAVTVTINGKEEKHTIEANLGILCRSLFERGDPRLAYTARLELEVRENNR